jgi:branched-chain amino acid transport system ATP-binding protein
LSQEMFRKLRQIADQADVGVLMVEQNARLSLDVADFGYLLENGRIVGQGRASELRTSPEVLRAFLGSAVARAG